VRLTVVKIVVGAADTMLVAHALATRAAAWTSRKIAKRDVLLGAVRAICHAGETIESTSRPNRLPVCARPRRPSSHLPVARMPVECQPRRFARDIILEDAFTPEATRVSLSRARRRESLDRESLDLEDPIREARARPARETAWHSL
jgi:hypothetical protein